MKLTDEEWGALAKLRRRALESLMEIGDPTGNWSTIAVRAEAFDRLDAILERAPRE